MRSRILLVALLSSCGAGTSSPPSNTNLPKPPPAHGLAISDTPPAALGVIASSIGTAIVQGHYLPKPVDDALSADWFDHLILDLDPAHIYFTDRDVAALSHWRTQLDDDLRSPHPTLAPAWEIHRLWVKRVQERVAFARKLVADDAFTFTDPNATIDLNREDIPAPTAAELDKVWRKRVAEQLLQLELSGEAHDRALQRLDARFERIDPDVRSLEVLLVLSNYLAAFTHCYDPHSVWFMPISKENFDIEMSDRLTGIGARLQLDQGYTTIVDLIAGGPASKDGRLKPGDRILAVAQDGAQPVDIVDMRLDKVVQLIRGNVGTRVVLTVHPADASDPAATREIALIRDEVKLEEAAAKGSIQEVGGKRVGVIDMPSFYVDYTSKESEATRASSNHDIEAILRDFHAKSVDAVVVDLRTNGGGALDQAIKVTGLFLKSGPVVQVRDREGKVEVLRDEDNSIGWGGPLVVLTSERSASASEIFAAAIQDYGRGLIVGAAQTHGKGSVQNIFNLGPYLNRIGETEAAAEGGALKFTTHMFYRVNGGSTQVRGVIPDIILPSPYQGLDILESDLDAPLPWSQIPATNYPHQTLAIDLDALRQASQKRVDSDMMFGFLAEDLAQREHEDDGIISLNRATREAEIERNKTIGEARETALKLHGDDPDDPPDALLNEAAAIAADLAAQLTGK